jgi:predicted exporter
MCLLDALLVTAVFTAYVTLTVTLSRGIAHLLGVHPAILAFPLAVAPVVILARTEWRQSWIILIPMVAAVFFALRSPTNSWRWTAYVACSAFILWIILTSFARLVREKDDDGQHPAGQIANKTE